MVAHLARAEARFDFLVQLRDDPEAMSIEDSTIEWSETQAPFSLSQQSRSHGINRVLCAIYQGVRVCDIL